MTDTPQDQPIGEQPPVPQQTTELPPAPPATTELPAAQQPATQQPATQQPLAQQSLSQPTFGFPRADAQPTAAAPRAKRPIGAGVVAGLIAAALVGGVSGAGVAVWAVTANQPTQAQGPRQGSSTITVNDTANVSTVTAVAAKASPSVVTISVTGGTAAGTGSGVILSQDGYIVTNTHVVTLDGSTGAAAIKVETTNGQLFDATVVGTDPISDLAVIKLKNASGLTPAVFGDSSKLNVGQVAIAIGAPLGLSDTVTNGIVSAINRSITVASSAVPNQSSSGGTNSGSSPFDFWNFNNGTPSQGRSAAAASIALPVIQTDAAINPGNSGGALLNANAEVIGLNVAIASAGSTSGSSGQSGSIGVGFAIPSNLVQRITGELIKNGKASHGLLGAGVYDVTEDPSIKSSSVVGASIEAVTPGGAAEKAGLQTGDIVTNFNGIPITGKTDLTAQVRVLAAGASAPLTYVRNGKSATVTVTVGELK